ncbi:DNA polymerase III subunit alpha [Candidatus Sumerlaeota bacterium]|nr:DNA polymerase III subunit alpha [Candidatus Sumerlaeota bacterium]
MFIQLHIHSHYSFLDSTLRVEEIVAAACRAGMNAVALTDTNGLYAVVPFVKTCREAGVRPIIGAEIVWEAGCGKREVGCWMWDVGGGKKEARGKRSEVRGQSEEANNDFSSLTSNFSLLTSNFPLRAVVLARDRSGYAELSRLVTQRQLEVGCGKWEVGGGRLEAGSGRREAGSEKLEARGQRSEVRSQRSEVRGQSEEASNNLTSDFSLLTSNSSLLDLSEEHVWILTDSPALLRLLAGRRNVFAELILTERRRAVCRNLYDLACALRIPLVATCDVHFARPDDYQFYRLLRAIRTQRTIETLDDEAEVGGGKSEAGNQGQEARGKRSEVRGQRYETVDKVSSLASHFPLPTSNFPPLVSAFFPVDEEHYFKTADEMARTFRGLRSALRNTRFIAERCEVDWLGRETPLLGEWKFPRVAASGGLPSDETAFSHLWKVTFEGLKQRYRPLTIEAMRRLEYELEVISRMGFCDYFLAVNEIAEEARRRGWLFLGRGSAANSIVSFALGLTPVDPIRHNLYFERFLNPERRSPPDIDLDFSWKERDAVVRWIFDRFGHDRVALISTHITLQPRQAIREAAKAMGIAEAEVNHFTRPIPGWLGGDFTSERMKDEGRRMKEEDGGRTLADLPSVFPECRGLPVGEEPWKTVLVHAQRLLGFPRHLSIHCGGLLITPDPITDYTPLQRSAKGPIITQMEMRAIESLGLIKIDILGNRSLGVMTDCLRLLEVGNKLSEKSDCLPDAIVCTQT